jgi:hypothetical protein
MQSWFFTETQALEYFGMWFFYNSLADTGICASMCAFTCAAGVLADATWRSLLCLPPPFRVCDLTTMIADGCPSGYYPCIGSGTGGDAAGNYTITCTE